MNINTVLQTGIEGVRQGVEGADKAASEIVRAGTVDGPVGSNDVVEPIVELRLYERSIEASAQVVTPVTLSTLIRLTSALFCADNSICARVNCRDATVDSRAN